MRRVADALHDEPMYDQMQGTIHISLNRISTASSALAGALVSESKCSIPSIMLVGPNRVDVWGGGRV
jgi:hypothetical protein